MDDDDVDDAEKYDHCWRLHHTQAHPKASIGRRMKVEPMLPGNYFLVVSLSQYFGRSHFPAHCDSASFSVDARLPCSCSGTEASSVVAAAAVALRTRLNGTGPRQSSNCRMMGTRKKRAKRAK